tara:strand:+ start:5166 stop:13220 length:8055 start_codon:yes stop_codon:yes gene_type:complete
MASPYEALKVQNLIRTYKTNPTMFNDDQLDELESLAEQNEINFKRSQSEFSLQRGLQQAQAGFIEGLTTFDLIPKEPRNTGEAIFRQLGHLAGFAPAILKAPVVGLAKVAAKVTGKKTSEVLGGTITRGVMDSIDALDKIALPMVGSRATKKLFDKGLSKSGADALDFLKQGSRTRAITEEALGLASASAISNIWKGQDAIVDSYIGGAIAGGAFGGIGNFVSLGNLYKGNVQQVDKANKLLRAGVASAFMGVPSTLRNDPTEMQIYEYLLGGFFGYNTRPAKETEAGKWINQNRQSEEIFKPEKSEDWNKVSKDAQEYILREHPMTKESNSEGHGGSTGAALQYLETWAKRTNKNPLFRQAAIKHFEKNKIEYTEKDIQDYYRTKAAEIYTAERGVIENATIINNSIVNDAKLDRIDNVEKEFVNIKDLSSKINKVDKKLGTTSEIGKFINEQAEASIKDNIADVEVFMDSIKTKYGNQVAKDRNSEMRSWYRNRVQPFQPMDVVTLTDGKLTSYRKITNDKVGDVSIGEKYERMPIQYLVPEAEVQLMTHVVKENAGIKEAVKIMDQSLVKGNIEYLLSSNELRLVQDSLAEQGRYMISGVKDKDFVMTSKFRDGGKTIDEVFSILSNGNFISKPELELTYKRSLVKEKELLGDTPEVERLHERKWISNVVNLSEMNNLPIEQAYIMLDPNLNYGKSVADLNKRITLMGNRMTPMVASSFKNVEGTSEGKKLNTIIIKDKNTTGDSDVDGLMEFRSDVTNASLKAMGRDVNNTGHFKPVIAAKTNKGFLATKSNGQEAFPNLNEWMTANNIHVVMSESSAKLRGSNEMSELSYKNGNYSSNKLNVIEVPIDTLQISSGTYENTYKDTRKGTGLPMQFWSQANEQQAKGFSDAYIKNVLMPSINGTEKSIKIVDNFKTSKDIKEFSKEYEKAELRLEELPLDFVLEKLTVEPDTPIGKFLSDRLMKLDLKGELEKTANESFEYDSDSAFREYHDVNRLLANALEGTFVAKHSMSFNKNNYFNALRKYVTKRMSNPHIETAGKSWLKGYRPEMLNYADIDPAKKTRKLREGEVYLDNGFREMPVVLFDKKYTLGEVWDMYTGKQTMPKGVKTPTKKEWNDVFNFLVIRTPADSMSGTRKLRFVGFTNQKGAGSFTHHKDNVYLGGADKDADSIKIFQNINKEVIKHFESVSKERSHWFNKDGSKSDYQIMIDKMFEGNLPEISVKDYNNNKAMMFSPSFRFEAARNSATGKQGLGYGLSAKIAMQNMYDYVQANGGRVSFDKHKVTLRTKSPDPSISAHRHFLDLGTKIVNVSADASKDPNLKAYNTYRDTLFNSIFEVNNKKFIKYTDFMKMAKGTAFEALKISNDNVKPHQKIFDNKGKRKAPTLFEALELVDSSNRILEKTKGINSTNPKIHYQMQRLGFDKESYKFEKLQSAHRILYNNILRGDSPLFLNVLGKVEIRNNVTSKELQDFYKIVAKELSFTTPKDIKEKFKGTTEKIEEGLDFIGKEFGQYATIELLADQYVKVQTEFAKQNKNVNSVSEFIPQIKERAYEVKRLADKLSNKKERDNVLNNDIDAKIVKTQNELAQLELAQKLPEGMLQDYFNYWLLSPIRELQKGVNQPQYNKLIHGSPMIPMAAKKTFYQRMDTIYDRAMKMESSLDIKQADIEVVKNESTITEGREFTTKINDAIRSKNLEGLALFKGDLKEIQKFQSAIDVHPEMKKDFNQWYEGFTYNMNTPKDATTLDMNSIRMVNKYLESLNSNKEMDFKLKNWYMHPLTVNEEMQAKGMFGTYHKIINAPIETSKGIAYRDLKVAMSPVGNIANYFKKSEASMGKYEGRSNLERLKTDELYQSLTTSEKQLYMENIFKFREREITLDKLDPKIDKVKFEKLNNEITNLWKQFEKQWITTKSKGNRFDWSIIDKDFKYNNVNEYIKYDRNGKFDFKTFERDVINAREQTKQLIETVGLEGILRYRYEYKLEKALQNSKLNTKQGEKPVDAKKFREKYRSDNPFGMFKPRKAENFMHHSVKNSNEKLLLEQVTWLAQQKKKLSPEEYDRLAKRMEQDNPFINSNDIIDISSSPMKGTSNLGTDKFFESPFIAQGSSPYKRTYDSITDYQSNLNVGYHRNLMKLKAQNEIDVMMKNMESYKPSKKEMKYFNDLYVGKKASKIPVNLRYNNYKDVWADYVRLYARDSLGYQSFYSDKMMTPQGRQLLHLNKKNMHYVTSDAVMIKQLEKLYQKKLGKGKKISFFDNQAVPKDGQARKEYFSRKIHNLGRLEAQYQLLSLLANTGTWSTNIFGGATMTVGSAGVKNYANSFNNERVYRTLLSDSKGKPVLKLFNGEFVKNRKQLMTYLEERGVIENYIKNEFEYNEGLKSELKNLGVNIKDFQRDFIKAAKSKKGNRDESVREVVSRYGVSKVMLNAGGYLMKQSERVNRLNAFISHGMQAVEGFKEAGKDLSLADQYVFERAERGIEMTQFLYQNAARPAFMRTSTGKVLGRFKLFVFNSIRMRKEFYKQAKLNGFKEGSESYNRFKDTFAIDMFMYALGSAFMFSLFDTTLPPPWDWVQALADYTFGDKKEKQMAFFDSKLGPLNVLKPPIARVPEAFGELLTGNVEDFTNYTMYTMLPFGRGIRQIKQLADDRPKRGLERAPEILLRLPNQQVRSRIKRMKDENRKRREIKEYLN